MLQYGLVIAEWRSFADIDWQLDNARDDIGRNLN